MLMLTMLHDRGYGLVIKIWAQEADALVECWPANEGPPVIANADTLPAALARALRVIDEQHGQGALDL